MAKSVVKVAVGAHSAIRALWAELDKPKLFKRNKKFSPFRWDFQVLKYAVGHTNAGRAQIQLSGWQFTTSIGNAAGTLSLQEKGTSHPFPRPLSFQLLQGQ